MVLKSATYPANADTLADNANIRRVFRGEGRVSDQYCIILQSGDYKAPQGWEIDTVTAYTDQTTIWVKPRE